MQIDNNNSVLTVTMGYFDSQGNFSGILYNQNVWNLWVYKADSNITIFNGNVSGSKSFNTSGWQSGVYILKGTVNGNNYVKKFFL